MLTIDNILMLSAAGYTKAEINALATAAAGVQKPDAKPEQKQDTPVDITAQLSAISQQLTALTAPKPDVKPEQKQTDVLALLQSMNVSGQRYDLPPQYDVEKNLASYFSDMIGGEKEKGDK